MVDGYAVLIGIAYGPENTAERNAVLEAVKMAKYHRKDLMMPFQE